MDPQAAAEYADAIYQYHREVEVGQTIVFSTRPSTHSFCTPISITGEVPTLEQLHEPTD
jgi:hypothetical protein